jgi:hypothetical protein
MQIKRAIIDARLVGQIVVKDIIPKKEIVPIKEEDKNFININPFHIGDGKTKRYQK